jgi:hypothetical protein
MKVSCFTFVRNAIKYDYPVVESINSILPICDEIIVAIGNSEDETVKLIESINSPKIRIIHTIWDDTLRTGGQVLAVETDKSFAEVAPDTDWAIYLQADEVIHEKYLPIIKAEMEGNLMNEKIDGLLFKYLHFYGSYQYIADSFKWYRREIRVLRNRPDTIKSYRDAQGFRFSNNKKLNVKLIDAYIFHYGWVKPTEKQREKIANSSKYWLSDEKLNAKKEKYENFDYSEIDSLSLFSGSQPKVMKPRIEAMNWAFNFDIKIKKLSPKNKIRQFIEKLTGWRIGEYRNYILKDKSKT